MQLYIDIFMLKMLLGKKEVVSGLNYTPNITKEGSIKTATIPNINGMLNKNTKESIHLNLKKDRIGNNKNTTFSINSDNDTINKLASKSSYLAY